MRNVFGLNYFKYIYYMARVKKFRKTRNARKTKNFRKTKNARNTRNRKSSKRGGVSTKGGVTVEAVNLFPGADSPRSRSPRSRSPRSPRFPRPPPRYPCPPPRSSPRSPVPIYPYGSQWRDSKFDDAYLAYIRGLGSRREFPTGRSKIIKGHLNVPPPLGSPPLTSQQIVELYRLLQQYSKEAELSDYDEIIKEMMEDPDILRKLKYQINTDPELRMLAEGIRGSNADPLIFKLSELLKDSEYSS